MQILLTLDFVEYIINILCNEQSNQHQTNTMLNKLQCSLYSIVKQLRKDNDVHCGSQNVSQRMFKLSTICTDTASQSPAPLSDRIVNHMLAEFFPFLHNPLTQFTDILNLLLVNCIIPHTAYSLGFRCRLLSGHSAGGIKSGVICFSSCVSLAR